MCASRACQSGRKCFRAGRVTGMAAPTAMLGRKARADSRVGGRGSGAGRGRFRFWMDGKYTQAPQAGGQRRRQRLPVSLELHAGGRLCALLLLRDDNRRGASRQSLPSCLTWGRSVPSQSLHLSLTDTCACTLDPATMKALFILSSLPIP